MKKFWKVTLIVIGCLLFFTALGLSYIKFALPDVGEAPDIKVEITPKRVKRGEYLANHVTSCIDCHSTRDWSKFAGPLEAGTEGSGGERFDKGVGFPGEVYVPNITPYHLKDWTDGELYRAITAGVKKDGSAIFPIMPYKYYGKMDKEDIYSIIAYVRTLPVRETNVPDRELDFPLNFLVNTMPLKGTPEVLPSASKQVEYGAYLVRSAACIDCHTRQDKGNLVPGMEFAGGSPYKVPSGTVFSANITPDKESGIGKWTKEQFIARFKSYGNPAGIKNVGDRDMQTIMPWTMYAGMKDSDLEAIYAYLQTVKPISNRVGRFE